jgi:HEPN domain-containing protein
MKKITREWVRKADADYRLAAKLAKGSEPFHDQLCFHCQQSAEKYLKALLEELAQAIPRTHILSDLLTLLIPHHPGLRSLQRGLKLLTRFAVGSRYPGESASKRQAVAALRWAGQVRGAASTLLGIRVGSPRRKKRGKREGQ